MSKRFKNQKIEQEPATMNVNTAEQVRTINYLRQCAERAEEEAQRLSWVAKKLEKFVYDVHKIPKEEFKAFIKTEQDAEKAEWEAKREQEKQEYMRAIQERVRMEQEARSPAGKLMTPDGQVLTAEPPKEKQDPKVLVV